LNKTEFTLIHSARRTVQLEIGKSGEIIVKAPYGYTKSRAEAFVESHSDWINSRQPAIIERSNVYAAADREKNLVPAARAALTALTKKYASIMGAEPQYVGITSAKKRFGSCTAQNGINYSKYLMLYPTRAVEYVVVHELAHTRHHNHSKEFYNFISRFMSDYKEREKLLLPQNASAENIESNVQYALHFR